MLLFLLFLPQPWAVVGLHGTVVPMVKAVATELDFWAPGAKPGMGAASVNKQLLRGQGSLLFPPHVCPSVLTDYARTPVHSTKRLVFINGLEDTLKVAP
jgi:hypothetical protein